MQELKRMIKEKKIEGVFLLYGEEKFILQSYLDKMIEVALSEGDASMNLDIFDSPSIDIDKVLDALDTLPFLSDKRVVVLKGLELVSTKQANKAEKLVDYLPKLPPSTVCIIVETEMDKRSRLYKKVNELGHVVEFKTLSENDLIKYIIDRMAKEKLQMDVNVARHFINVVGYDLTTIHNEMGKLRDYSKQIVTTNDIDEICTRSIENRIFELVDCIGTRQKERALKLYEDLLLIKEPPIKILYMITRQFRLILQTKLLLESKADRQTMLNRLKVPPFVLDKNIKQSKNFTVNTLKQALQKCLDAELNMKTGNIPLELGIELLVLENSL